jgi:hypothetical protein
MWANFCGKYCRKRMLHIEKLNSILIEQGLSKKKPFRFLVDTVKKQRKALVGIDIIKSLRKVDQNTFIEAKNNE